MKLFMTDFYLVLRDCLNFSILFFENLDNANYIYNNERKYNIE